MKNETNNETIISKEEALRKVAEVLEEALAEYEALEKMDLQLAEDPSRPMIQDEAPAEEERDDEESAEEPEAKEDDEEEKDEDEDKDEKEMSDEALKSEYASIIAKMEHRGLIRKEEKVAKSESESELKKAMETEIGELKKTINSLAETVSKIAAQPAATRKGVSGLAPLRKSEEGEDKPLRKSEVVEKLLELKKSGDRRVNTALINRVETSRMTSDDLNFIKGILG